MNIDENEKFLTKCRCLLSVVIPVYNVRPYIGECLDSILRQINSSVEVLIVDDGSTDGSGAVARDFAVNKYPEWQGNVVFLQKENGGLSSARNYGVLHASGEYIFFLDSDDVVDSSLINIFMEAVADDLFDMISFEHVRFDDKAENSNFFQCCNNPGYKVVNKYFYLNKGFYAWNKIFRCELIKKHPFPVGVDFEDICTIPFLLLDSKCIKHIDATLYGYRIRPGSITRSTSVAIKLSTALEYLACRAREHDGRRFIYNCIIKETLGVLLSVIRCQDYSVAHSSISKQKALFRTIRPDIHVFRIGFVRLLSYVSVKYIPMYVWKVIIGIVHGKN